MRGIMHSYPMQIWSLLPILERLFSDYSENNIHWQPMKLEDPTWTWDGLSRIFTLQNRVLFSILEQHHFNAVQRTFNSMVTGLNDNESISSQASDGDGVGVISHWLHYHMQQSHIEKMKIVDVFNWAYGLFGTGNVTKSVATLRKYIPSARRLHLKLSWHRVIYQSAMVLSERHVAFIHEMERFKKVEPQYEDNALPLIDGFLSRVQRVADSITQILPRSTSRDINYAKATFHSFYTKLDGEEPFSMHEEDDRQSAYATNQDHRGNTNQRKPLYNTHINSCRGQGCKAIIDKETLRKLNLTQATVGTLCKACFQRMLDEGTRSIKGGYEPRKSTSFGAKKASNALKMNKSQTKTPYRPPKGGDRWKTLRTNANVAYEEPKKKAETQDTQIEEVCQADALHGIIKEEEYGCMATNEDFTPIENTINICTLEEELKSLKLIEQEHACVARSYEVARRPREDESQRHMGKSFRMAPPEPTMRQGPTNTHTPQAIYPIHTHGTCHTKTCSTVTIVGISSQHCHTSVALLGEIEMPNKSIYLSPFGGRRKVKEDGLYSALTHFWCKFLGANKKCAQRYTMNTLTRIKNNPRTMIHHNGKGGYIIHAKHLFRGGLDEAMGFYNQNSKQEGEFKRRAKRRTRVRLISVAKLGSKAVNTLGGAKLRMFSVHNPTSIKRAKEMCAHFEKRNSNVGTNCEARMAMMSKSLGGSTKGETQAKDKVESTSLVEEKNCTPKEEDMAPNDGINTTHDNGHELDTSRRCKEIQASIIKGEVIYAEKEDMASNNEMNTTHDNGHKLDTSRRCKETQAPIIKGEDVYTHGIITRMRGTRATRKVKRKTKGQTRRERERKPRFRGKDLNFMGVDNLGSTQDDNDEVHKTPTKVEDLIDMSNLKTPIIDNYDSDEWEFFFRGLQKKEDINEVSQRKTTRIKEPKKRRSNRNKRLEDDISSNEGLVLELRCFEDLDESPPSRERK